LIAFKAIIDSEVNEIVTRKHNIPNMILIGSTARNSGKTTLAISIINKYKLNRPVVGLKVTTIHEKNGKCIRGGEGCGVCSNLKGNFEITEELNSDNNKDTSLLLAAGAENVYWLKTLKNNIYEGFEVFIKQIPENTLIVCESNSLRKVVNPGVFIMVKNTRDSQIKKSASEVIDQADIIIENNFNDDFQEIIKEIENIIN
jgi:predicted P-loop ATPase/GTPase